MARPRGLPRTGGRQKGTPNKATAEIRELAREHAPACVAELARLSTEAQSESARVQAIGMLLDRAYGKASQSQQIDVSMPVGISVEDLTDEELLAIIATGRGAALSEPQS